ncbi:MAG: hypothetical protein IJX53_00475 [Clostridia bacterium]|nr:hypothetical protein [Clostridia bacterium]
MTTITNTVHHDSAVVREKQTFIMDRARQMAPEQRKALITLLEAIVGK